MDDAMTELRSTMVEQHAHIRAMFAGVADSAGEVRQAAFDTLRRYLAMHEAAEEECLHPLTQRASDGGRVAEERVAEERLVGSAITELERHAIDSAEFAVGFEHLRAAVAAHAEAEEQHELPALGSATAEELKHAQLALSLVPTLAAGDGHAIAMPTEFAFADLHAAAKAKFRALPEGVPFRALPGGVPGPTAEDKLQTEVRSAASEG